MAPADALAMLGKVTLPNVTKYVVTAGKFDTSKAAKTFNIEAGYPAEPAQLQTLAALAEVGSGDPRPCDGRDLWALRAILQQEQDFDFALLLRNAAGVDEIWPELMRKVEQEPFAVFGSGMNVLLNLRHERAREFLDRIQELHSSGAVYAIDEYSMEYALAAAARSLCLEQQFATE
jgi:hypothetical protein